MATRLSLLLIEDSPGECELFRLALDKAGVDVELVTRHEPQAAWHVLTARAYDALPVLILLDWHLPPSRGDEFLTRMRTHAPFASIPVIVFSTSDDSSDIAAGYSRGANGYVVKPGTFDELVRFAGDLCRYWLQWNRSLSVAGMPC